MARKSHQVRRVLRFLIFSRVFAYSMSKHTPIGAFFTPIKWAKWLITKYSISDSWLEGKTVCDPTAGNGIFLEALIELALEKRIKIKNLPVKRLFGIEKEKKFILDFKKRISKRFGIDFPEDNFICADIILSNPGIRADILVGNPPWQNFADLPEYYKEKVKPFFHRYKLANNAQKLLLGSSRIDIASLVISITINENLNKDGNAYFFVPLSLFLNEGAHRDFRKGIAKDTTFAIREIHDFNRENIFNKILTSYGTVHLQRDSTTFYPVKYVIKCGDTWTCNFAKPLYSDDDPLSISKDKNNFFKPNINTEVDESSKPRQGVNTCGANDIFIFRNTRKLGTNICVNAANGKNLCLPGQFVFPLISKKNFSEKYPTPSRYILITHDRVTGKPVSESQLRKYPNLWHYLLKNKKLLSGRKGVLINTCIRKNLWWGLLGVGKYSFSPYKVVWESYGSRQFNPTVFTSFQRNPWQAHQSLQAYMPFASRSEAEKILSCLKKPAIEKYLHSFRTQGTCNWAQPGKITRILKFKNSAFK